VAGEVAGKFRRYRCDACRIISLKRRANDDECDKKQGKYDTEHDVNPRTIVTRQEATAKLATNQRLFARSREQPMNEEYRGLRLYGGCEPISETLLGQVTQWRPTGCIAYKHRTGLITELTRFQFPMTCDDENVAKCFGLEVARILLDSRFRDFAIGRYESEKRRIQEVVGGQRTGDDKRLPADEKLQKDPQDQRDETQDKSQNQASILHVHVENLI